MMRRIHGEEIFGVGIDPQTRCEHYHGPTDIIALRFRCCDRWFPCFECHRDTADHEAEVWPREAFCHEAILCGNCGRQLSITDYMEGSSACPECGSGFNPKCSGHYHLYFDI